MKQFILIILFCLTPFIVSAEPTVLSESYAIERSCWGMGMTSTSVWYEKCTCAVTKTTMKPGVTDVEEVYCGDCEKVPAEFWPYPIENKSTFSVTVKGNGFTE